MTLSPPESGDEGFALPESYADFKVVEVMSVTLELPDQFPNVTLQEAAAPLRQLIFPVGPPEGAAIAYALRRLDTPRPLTHELFANVLRALNVDIVAVRLVGRTAGTYLGELDLMGSQGHEIVECRASDGLVMALRQTVRAPVLVDERLLSTGGDVAPPT
jgi:uncharacterized protein